MTRLRAGGAILFVVALAGIAAVVLSSRRSTHAAFFPQYRRVVADKLYGSVLFATQQDPRGMELVVPAPPKPKLDPTKLPSVAAYQAAIANKDDHPGTRAFRADTDLYCEINKNELEEKARKEGITTDEVKELTFFGFAAMRTTQPDVVASVLGRKLTLEEVGKLDAILKDENESFTRAMHQQVDEGAPAERRWEVIRTYEQYYRDKFFETFGITDAQFDKMLAPDDKPAGVAGPKALPTDVHPPPAEVDPNAAPPPPHPPPVPPGTPPPKPPEGP